MKILDLLKNVSIDVNATCSNKDEAIDTLVSLMAKQGNLNDQDVYKQGIYNGAGILPQQGRHKDTDVPDL